MLSSYLKTNKLKRAATKYIFILLQLKWGLRIHQAYDKVPLGYFVNWLIYCKINIFDAGRESEPGFFQSKTAKQAVFFFFFGRNCLAALALQRGPPHQTSNKNKQVTKATWGLMNDKSMSLEQPSADRLTLHLCSFPAVYEVIHTKMVGQTLYRWIIVHSVVVRVQRGD